MSTATSHATSPDGQQSAEANAPSLATSPATPNLLRDYKWRSFAVRGSSKVQLQGVQSVTWDDADMIMTGSLTLTDLAYGMGQQLQVDEGDMIALECDSGGGFVELWRMRISSPDVTTKARQRTYQLANDLDLLNRSDDDWYFTAGPKTDHPTGWTFDEIVRYVCDRYGVSLGPIPVGKYKRVKSWSHRGESPIYVMQTAINVERQHTGRRFTAAWKNQQLTIIPFQRSDTLLELGATLIDAELQSHLPAGEDSSGINEGYFASSVTMRGLRNEPIKTDKQKRTTQQPKKMEVSHDSKASISRFGYVHRIVWSGDAKTDADLDEEALQYLAAIAKPIKTVTMTLPGLPTITRGDAIKLAIGDEGLQNQIVWVTEASHNLDPSQYTTVLTVTFDDPYLDKVAELIQSRVSDTQIGAEKIANHLKPKKAATRAPADPNVTGGALPTDVQAANDRLVGNEANEAADGGFG